MVRAPLRLLRHLWRHHRNLSLTVALMVFAFVFAGASGYWLIFRLAYLLLLVIPLSYAWTRLNLRGLRVEVERSGERLQEGDLARERIVVTNTSWLPKLWLEVEDPTDLPGHHAKAVLTLGGRKRRSWRVQTPCRRRGVYQVGPVRVTVGDPFGLFQQSRTFGRAGSLVVYPRPLELRAFAAPPANLPGEGHLRRPTPFLTPNASGVRDYQPGDGFNRIHWLTTARLERLMVKQFEMDPSSDLWMVVDMEEQAHAGSGDESSEEYAVKVAASVARYFLVRNRSLGFITFGQRLQVVEAERGNPQLNRILEALALVRAVGDVPLDALLSEEGKRFGRHTTLIIVTPSGQEPWTLSVQHLLRRGVRTAVVLLDASSFGAAEGSLLVVSTLAATDVPTYLVRRGDDLATVLEGAPSGLAGSGLSAEAPA